MPKTTEELLKAAKNLMKYHEEAIKKIPDGEKFYSTGLMNFIAELSAKLREIPKI